MLLDSFKNVPLWRWIAGIAILMIGRALSYRYQKGLNKYNGPFLASITDLWRFWQALYHWDRVTYSDVLQYGKVIRLGPNTLLFPEPDAIKDIYTTGFRKSNQYRVAAGVSKGQVVANIFSTTDKEWHGRLRRSVSNAFALSTLIQYEPQVTSTLTAFLRVARRDFADRPGEAGVVDFAQYSRFIALDVISALTYGTSYGLLEAGRDTIGITQGRTKFKRYVHLCYNWSWLDGIFYKNPILLWLGRMGWYNKTTATVPFAQKQISARHSALDSKIHAMDLQSSDGTRSADLLTKFLNAKADFPEVVEDRAVLGLTLSMVNAGSGTIATTLSAIVYYLLKSSQVMNKLMSELDAHFPPPQSPVNDMFEDWVVPFGEAQKLPYLDACMKETFRIHPSLGGQLMERVTPPEGAIIAGEQIPGGTRVSSNAWLTHRHKPTYGTDVETFRPERWLECDSQQLSTMNSALLVFGAGPNTCIGKNIGLLELYKMVPTILRMFKIEQVDPHAEWKIFNLGDPEPSGFSVRFTSRHR